MKKGHKSIRVAGIIMLIYSFWFCIGSFYLSGMWPRCLIFPWMHSFFMSLPPIVRLPLMFREPIFFRGSSDWYLYISMPSLLGAFFVGLIYLISSIGILRLKNWGRILGVYFSALMLVSVIVQFICEIIARPEILYPGNSSFGFPFLVSVIIIPFMIPSFLFLLFFIHPKIRKQFKQCLVEAKRE